MKKNALFIGLFALVLIGLPAAIYVFQQTPEIRSRATASTTLSFQPTSTASAPEQVHVNDTVPLDVYINPGNNLPSVVKLDILFDATKLQLATIPFSPNLSAFPTTMEGPVTLNGEMLISLSIGSDPSKAIQKTTKVGTVNFIAGQPTDTPVIVSFGTKSQVLSIGPSDLATENVLSTSMPAYITIAGQNGITPTITPIISVVPTNTPIPSNPPTATPLPTSVPTSTPIISPTPFISPTPLPPTPTLAPNSTAMTFSLLLHDIGNIGDNPNPQNSSLSNKNPLHQQRIISISIFDSNNQLVATQSGPVNYNSSNGDFSGTIDMGNLAGGQYIVKVKSVQYLRRIIPGIQSITGGQNNTLPSAALVAGDINDDNTINILDYNILLGCYSDLTPAVSCSDVNKVLADLNDDGSVNQIDYNIFVREISVQNGN